MVDKKKKSGRTPQEGDDLDKILMELGMANPGTEVNSGLQPEQVTRAEQVMEEDSVQSAAACKRKKRREKEKLKKAAAAVEEKPGELQAAAAPKTNGAKGKKAADKKVPKAVREMQEALSRLREAEERKTREEEERQRKEEEEQRRQEELQRQAEEARLRKKAKEKEKLLKKKQEGRLLTAKQKEEARRQAAMREQILANANLPPLVGTGSRPTKRPLYYTKKSKESNHRSDGTPSPVKETESVEAIEAAGSELDETPTVAGSREENVPGEDEDGDEWDSRSFDDLTISLKSEGDDSDTEQLKHQQVKKTLPQDELSQRNKRRGASPVAEASGPAQTPKPSGEALRSPICCIMGHVDAGKTKLLDCIRGTNVQEGEAGGITQQIGATYFPADNIRERTGVLKHDATLKVPGLLVIDTPGHESFANLRSRGSGLCDIAILVVDVMSGLEPQTVESLNLLKMRNTEFIVALNKVDRLYGWKTCRDMPIVKALKQQNREVQNEFNMRLIQIITQFKEQGLNTELYYKNREMGETFSIVPTSAIGGEGIPDLLLLLVQWTQKTMVEKLKFRDEVQCTVLEVKAVEGHGTTIDVVLVNGVLYEGDQIVVCGLQGPITTTIRALLTPHPMKDLRVKGAYLHHKEIRAAQGIKITAQGLENACAGTGLYVVGPDDDVEDVKESAMEDMKSVRRRIDKSGEGVWVQASTLGSLEALLEFLRSPEVGVPVSGMSIGMVHKKDVMKASVMLEKKKEYATILAFDVKVGLEARELAHELGVKIFTADIIYHLFDQFKAYMDSIKAEEKREAADAAVFPCILKIVPNKVFNKDPIVLGVHVVEGIAKVGTPLCVMRGEFISIGVIASLENNRKPVKITNFDRFP